MKLRGSVNLLIVAAAMFLAAFANVAFFRNAGPALAGDPQPWLHAAALAVLLWSALVLLLCVFSFRWLLRPVLVLLFVTSAAAAYFMDTFNVIIDRDMLVNALQTDAAETGDLLTWRLAIYIALLGVLPSVLAWRVRLTKTSWPRALRSRVLLAGVALLAGLLSTVSSGAFMADFIREHKPVRYYSNPLTPLYSGWQLAHTQLRGPARPLEPIGEDARIPPADPQRELVVLVIGETARADRFSLNGYERDTNPELATRGVVSFDNVTACGTSTAVSVPCMFAVTAEDGVSPAQPGDSENLLDVLGHARVNVLWRDNNSGSKGVADRLPAEDFSDADRNPVCDIECRDEGMLAGLQEYVDSQPDGDILIVLHQMGSHGPAYFKRYPAEYEIFTPACRSEQLDQCTRKEIGNSYDNTIRYTDHFLARVVDFLAANDARFETVMLYISDHGESLGENGLYLHGMPNWLAPAEQVVVPMILWFGRHYDDVDHNAVRLLAHEPLSHGNLSHIVLGLFEIRSRVYDPALDVLQRARQSTGELTDSDLPAAP